MQIHLRDVPPPEIRFKISRIHKKYIAYIGSKSALDKYLTAPWKLGHSLKSGTILVRSLNTVYVAKVRKLDGLAELLGYPFVAVGHGLIVNTEFIRWRESEKGSLRIGFFRDPDKHLEFLSLKRPLSTQILRELKLDTIGYDDDAEFDDGGNPDHGGNPDRGSGSGGTQLSALGTNLRDMSESIVKDLFETMVRRMSAFAREKRAQFGLDDPRFVIGDPFTEWLVTAGQAIEVFMKPFVPALRLPPKRNRSCN